MFRGQALVSFVIEIIVVIIILFLFFGLIFPAVCHALVQAGGTCPIP